MRNRRKQIIVDKSFQYRQALGKVLVAVIAANVMIVLAFYFFPYELNAVIGPFTWAIALFEALLVATVLYLGARSSRRIAGPAYALKRDLRRLADGDLTVRTKFRKGDYLHDVANVFNATLDSLVKRVDDLRRSAENLRDSLPEDSPTRDQADRLVAQFATLSTEPSADPVQKPG